jgi:hypothetical protein
LIFANLNWKYSLYLTKLTYRVRMPLSASHSNPKKPLNTGLRFLRSLIPPREQRMSFASIVIGLESIPTRTPTNRLQDSRSISEPASHTTPRKTPRPNVDRSETAIISHNFP